MFKMYVASLNGKTLYLESTDKNELVERYNEFAKTNPVHIAQLVEDVEGKERVDLSEALRIKPETEILE